MKEVEKANKEKEKGGSGDGGSTLTEMIEEYQALLNEAESADFTDLERAQVLQTGLTLSGDPVVVFMPRLGFHDSRDSITQLRRMLLLFIKKAHHIVSRQYIFVYDHMQFSIFSQHPLIFRTYNMLPREYKKNISKMYVVHPTFLIRIFFEQGVKHFVSQKFYNKLKFVESVSELQKLIVPLGGVLPAAYIKRGDEKANTSKPRYDPTHMPPLTESFNPDLGTTDIIHQCVSYLNKDNRLQTKGLFRLAGDQALLDLAQARLFGRLDKPPTVIIGIAAYQESVSQVTSKRNPGQAKSTSYSTLVITDIHTVTSIMTQSLRNLPETLITPSVHTSMLELTKKFEKDQNIDEWHSSITPLLNSMPECHISTLRHLLRSGTVLISLTDLCYTSIFPYS
jgi:hypothetical protein